MATRTATIRVDRFAGLSDRQVPASLSRIESPDLLNVELSRGVMASRRGYTREHSTVLRDSSARLDGLNDYGKVAHVAAYNVTTGLNVSVHVVLRRFPTSECTVLSRGYGTGANRFFQLSYVPSMNGGLGGWRVRVYDATAGALRTLDVNDGTAGLTQIGAVRHLVFAPVLGTLYGFGVVDAAGAAVGTPATATVTSFVSQSMPWFVGCDTAAGTTAPADGDTSYFPGTVAEFRLWDRAAGGTDPTGRELTPTEYASTEGYWRLNDGNGSFFADLSPTNNPGVFGAEGPEWETTAARVVGPYGLRFGGEEGWIHGSLGSAWTSYFFTSTTQKWAVSLVFTPDLAAGETAVRDQVIFWFGPNGTDPHPLGLTVAGNVLRAHYRDSVSTKTVDLTTLPLAAVAGTAIRIVVSHYESGGVYYLGIAAIARGGQPTSASVATSGVVPGGAYLGTGLAIGLRCTQFEFPQTFGTVSCFGTVSDITFFKNLETANPFPTFLNLTNQQTVAFTPHTLSILNNIISPVPSGVRVVARIPFVEGNGTRLTVEGELPFAAYVYPDDEEGVRWDIGIVDPYEAPRITLIHDYRRFAPDGSVRRSKVVIAGTTLYEVANGVATPRAGNLHKGELWTAAAYERRLFLATRNGRRPRVLDAEAWTVDWVGLRAPQAIPGITTNAAGGSLAAGEYAVYVTYRNSSTGEESSPSPAAVFTTTGATSRVTQITVPRSPDPQVTERRIWCTAMAGAGLAAGTTAYLVGSLTDNLTTLWTTGFTSIPLAQITLEYSGYDEAPVGSSVAVWRDRLWVGGEASRPSRVYFSRFGRLTRFNLTATLQGEGGFEDLNRDTGDAVVGFFHGTDRLYVGFRDGLMAVTATGDTNTPFIFNMMNRDYGPAGPLAAYSLEGVLYYLSERDFYGSDGYKSANLSSPLDVSYPSIQYTMRTAFASQHRHWSCVAHYRNRGQFWISTTRSGSTRPDRVLVYTQNPGIWSIYDLPCDFLTAVEDDADDPKLYAGIEGFVCKLDSAEFDGHAAADVADIVGVASASGTTTTIVDTTKSWVVNEHRGKVCWFNDVSAGTVTRRKVASNTATTLTLYDVGPASAVGDLYVLGGIQFWFDLCFDAGSRLSLKTPRWVQVAGKAEAFTGSVVRLRLDLMMQSSGDAWEYPGDPRFHVVSEGSFIANAIFGGLGRNFRLRIGTSGIETASAEQAPSVVGTVEVQEVAMELEVKSARAQV